MAEQPAKTFRTMKIFADEDARQDFLDQKARRKYKAQVRKYRREAETDNGELNLTAMMDMMTILLVFLLKSYGAADMNVTINDDLRPPNSKSTLAPVQAVTLTITKKDIAVGERGLVQLEPGGNIPTSAFMPGSDGRPTLILEDVKEALDKEVEKLNRTAASNPSLRAKLGTDKDPTRMLTIVGDKNTPYKTLFSVLGTAGQSGLKYFKFLVISSSG